MQLKAREISQKFGNNLVLSEFNCSVEPGSCTVVTGPNGSGKSTLLRILAGLTRPTRGNVQIIDDEGKVLPVREARNYLGLVSPDIQLYGELTATENMLVFSQMRGEQKASEYFLELFQNFDLLEYAHALVGSFSSGMKQKLKIIFALSHNPFILLLDEPTTNLDEVGVKAVEEVVKRYKEENRSLVLTTNDAREAQKFGDKVIRLGEACSGSGG